MFNILVAEDDLSTNKLLCAVLKRAGFDPISANDGIDALEKLSETHADLLVCDVMMPRMDGFELTASIREGRAAVSPTLPILMLTARTLPEDRREGFIVGTDDYLTKPFDDQELVLRIKALLRRARIVDERRIQVGAVELEYDTNTVRLPDGSPQVLPPKEFQLLYKLLAYPERTFTRRQLLEEIWGEDGSGDDHTVNVHISRLRNRFYDCSEFEIQTVRGLGYRAVRKDGQEERSDL